jgi:hypothetical protein
VLVMSVIVTMLAHLSMPLLIAIQSPMVVHVTPRPWADTLPRRPASQYVRKQRQRHKEPYSRRAR